MECCHSSKSFIKGNDPDVDIWNEKMTIPCIVKDPVEVILPSEAETSLSDEEKKELKELYMLLTTNKEARKYTDADIFMEIELWKQYVEKLRAAGVKSIPGVKGEIQIQGRKTREIITETTKISDGALSKHNKVVNQGSEELIESVLNNELTINQASKIAGEFSKEEQALLLQSIKERGGDTEVSEVISTAVKMKKEKVVKLTAGRIKKDFKAVLDTIPKEGLYMDKTAEKEYRDLLNKVGKFINTCL